MKNNGSTLIWSLVICILLFILIAQAGATLNVYFKRDMYTLDANQAYFSAVNVSNLFADEICNETDNGLAIIKHLNENKSLSIDNITLEHDAGVCDVNIQMQNQEITINTAATKNNTIRKIKLDIAYDETTSPAAWSIVKYNKG